MPNHRHESVRTPKSAFQETSRTGRSKGLSTRNKVMAAVAAAGALAAIGQPLAANVDKPESQAAVQPVAQAQAQPLAPAVAGTNQAPAEKQARTVVPAAAQVASGYVKPTEGTFTSGFGARWGSSHKGIDIANSIGTPIKSVAAGEVINAGPASGFGQWVRVQHNDGTITAYGHINTIDVKVGQQVAAGEKIATLGNKGESTGPHLHFEVIKDGSKINPLSWLKDKGISVQ